MALGLAGGLAAGSGADMLQDILVRAERQRLAQQELAQRQQEITAATQMRERAFQADEGERKSAAEFRGEQKRAMAEAAQAAAQDRQRNDVLARLKLLPGGSLIGAESDLAKAAPENFQPDVAPQEVEPGFVGPREMRPTGKMKYLGTAEQQEKDAARKAAEASQTKLFEQQKELERMRGATDLAQARIAHPDKTGQSDASTAYRAEKTQRITDAVDDLAGRVNQWTTGYGNWLANMPNTQAKAFADDLNSLKSNIAFNELTEMRAASKTGGALGSVSERELQLLTSTLAGLDPQRPDFAQQLQKVRASVDRWNTAKQKFAGGATPITPAVNHGPSTGPAAAPVKNDPLGIR